MRNVEILEREGAEKWQEWLVEHNRKSARTVLWLSAIFYPLFGVLDYLIMPREKLGLLYASRAVVTACTLGMFGVLRTQLFRRHSTVLTASYIIVVGFGIAVMVHVDKGYGSAYYAGLNLVMIGAGLLFLWPQRVAMVTHSLIMLSYIVPNMFGATPEDAIAGITNFFFVGTTAVIVTAGQSVAYRSQLEQVIGQLTLERTKAHLERAHEELKRLDAFKSQFFANITHELRTPLAMILSPLELLEQGDLGPLSDEQRATVRTMFNNGMRLLKLIGDLLDLSKLEESQVRLRIAEHDLIGYLSGLVGQIEPLALRKGIEVKLETSAPRMLVWCDLERLERVFVNLLSNAAKFTPISGHIFVRARDLGDVVQIEVEDDGPGCPEDKALQIFERFFQVDMGGTRKYGGSGLGLALARELVDLHGGRIWAESPPGKGACFTVELVKDREHFQPQLLEPHTEVPKAPSEDGADSHPVDWAVQLTQREDFRLLGIAEATERRVVERDANEDQRAMTVLVVEDTRDVVRVVHLTLRQQFKVMAAADGLKGLEMAQRELPDLIITDLMMPGIDGLELTRRIRADARTRHIPIIMLTARGDMEDRVAGLDTGVNAYLAKPFSPKELMATARSLLNIQGTAADLLLTQRMDSLEMIAGGLAHEINNPLNYLKMAFSRINLDLGRLIESARDPAGDKSILPPELEQISHRAIKMVEAADSGIRRIAGTVELLGRYSREGFSRALQPYDVYVAAKDVSDMVRSAIGRDVRVELDFDGEGTVDCVPEELNQVLSNLIQNAIEAVPEGTGVVRLRGRADGKDRVLVVSDNGVGIKAGDQSKVFTPFFTTKAPGRGMGLGLTICWRVVQSLGGTISVQSQSGVGTEFTIRIPRSEGSHSKSPRAMPAAAGRPVASS